jgi:hypothetical protein
LSKNPEFNYTEFALIGFKKTFPILTESIPETVAEWLYETVSAFSGRDGRSNAGGGEDDIRCLIAAAANVELEVCAAREIKDALRTRLRNAWNSNDHIQILSVARGFERNASMMVIEHRDIDWIDPYRVLEDDVEEGIEISKEVEVWIDTLCEPSVIVSVIGNHSRKKLLSKPYERATKSLFGDF